MHKLIWYSRCITQYNPNECLHMVTSKHAGLKLPNYVSLIMRYKLYTLSVLYLRSMQIVYVCGFNLKAYATQFFVLSICGTIF